MIVKNNSKLFKSFAILSILLGFACATPNSNQSTSSPKSAPKKGTQSSKRAASTGSELKKSYECRASKDLRKVAFRQLKTGGCEIAYTKFGETQVVASAANDLSHCDEIYDRIRSKLEKAGFDCN